LSKFDVANVERFDAHWLMFAPHYLTGLAEKVCAHESELAYGYGYGYGDDCGCGYGYCCGFGSGYGDDCSFGYDYG
jgi:hypothetical protein